MKPSAPALPVSPPTALRTVAIIGLLAAPAVLLLVVLHRFAINVPVADDYFALLQFLEHWRRDVAGLRDGALLVWEQFYSHRAPVTRLAVLAESAWLGHVDLRLLCAITWACWTLFGASLVAVHWRDRPGRLWLLPAVLLLMQPQGESSLLSATGFLSHPAAILLGFWATRCALTPSVRQQSLALLLATGATLCVANGLLLFPVLALAALSRRWWSVAATWIVAGALMWAGYLHGYSTADQPIDNTGFSPGAFVLNLVTVAGAPLSLGTVPHGLVLAAGAVLLLAASARWFATWPAERGGGEPAFMLFLLLTLAMMAYARIGWPADYMLQDRYRPYAVTLAAVLYLHCCGRRQAAAADRVALPAAIAAAAAFNFLSYAIEWPQLVFAHHWAVATAENLKLDRELPLPSAPEQAAEAGQILRRATARGDLRLPETISARQAQAILQLPASPAAAETPAWTGQLSTDVGGVFFTPPAGVSVPPLPDVAVLMTGEGPLILPVQPRRARLADVLRQGRLLDTRYGLVLPTHNRVPGRHALYGLKKSADGGMVVLWHATVECP